MVRKQQLKLPRLPFNPLARVIAGDQPLWYELPEHSRYAEMRAARHSYDVGGVMTNVDIGAILGITRKSVERYMKAGIPFRTAEDFCDRIGVHPKNVWSDYYSIISDAEWDAAVEFEIARFSS